MATATLVFGDSKIGQPAVRAEAGLPKDTAIC